MYPFIQVKNYLMDLYNDQTFELKETLFQFDGSIQPPLNVYVQLYNNYIHPVLLLLFIKTCRIYNITNDFFMYLYNTNENIRTVVDKVQYNTSLLYSFLINRKTEPEQPVWLCSAWTTPNYSSVTKYYNYNEEYFKFFTKYFCNDLFEFYPDCNSGYALKYLESINSYIEKKPRAMFPLLIIKTTTPDDKSIVAVRRAKIPIEPFVYKQSKVKFICIEYVHKEMKNIIEINLEDRYYISGNELFTPTFVLRILEHQSHSYFFDENYKIRIMDSQCKIVEFGFDSYLLLTENGYDIVFDESITSELNKEEQISRLSHQNLNPFISTWLSKTGFQDSDHLDSENGDSSMEEEEGDQEDQEDEDEDEGDQENEADENEEEYEKLFIINPVDNLMSLYTSFEFGYKPLKRNNSI